MHHELVLLKQLMIEYVPEKALTTCLWNFFPWKLLSIKNKYTEMFLVISSANGHALFNFASGPLAPPWPSLSKYFTEIHLTSTNIIQHHRQVIWHPWLNTTHQATWHRPVEESSRLPLMLGPTTWTVDVTKWLLADWSGISPSLYPSTYQQPFPHIPYKYIWITRNYLARSQCSRDSRCSGWKQYLRVTLIDPSAAARY